MGKDQKDRQAIALIGEKGKKNALEIVATTMGVTTESVKDILKATAFKECATDAQFMAAVIVAATYRLNPLLKEMTAFPGKSGGVVPIVMIDGWINLVNRQPNYNGVELIENKTADGKLNKSNTDIDSVTSKFYIKGREHPVVVTEYMDECYDGTKGPWQKWPRRMLRHKAYIQGARVAFGFAGIYDEDEAERIRAGDVEIIDAPIIGLKHDKAAPAKDEAGKPSAPGSQVAEEVTDAHVVPAWNDFGDPERFGKNGPTMINNTKKCIEKLGEEKSVTILGKEGWTSFKELKTVAELSAVTNALLTAVTEAK
jgi:phage recombination protein Bet